MATKKTSRILAEIHDVARGLYDAGEIDTLTMRRFDALCLPAIADPRVFYASEQGWETIQRLLDDDDNQSKD